MNIKTTRFANNMKVDYKSSMFDEFLEDPTKWAMVRNIAKASLRDEYNKLIETTARANRGGIIVADQLMQEIKAHDVNQIVSSEKIIQNFNIEEKGTLNLNQILMNSEDITQNINHITRVELIEKVYNYLRSDLTLFLNHRYAIIAYIGAEDKVTNYAFSNLDYAKTYIFDTFIKPYGVDGVFVNLEEKVYGQKPNELYFQITTYGDDVKFMNGQIDQFYYFLKYKDKNKKKQYIFICIFNLKMFNKIKLKNTVKPITLNDNIFGLTLGSRYGLKTFKKVKPGNKRFDKLYETEVNKKINEIAEIERKHKLSSTLNLKDNKTVIDKLFGLRSKYVIKEEKEKEVKQIIEEGLEDYGNLNTEEQDFFNTEEQDYRNINTEEDEKGKEEIEEQKPQVKPVKFEQIKKQLVKSPSVKQLVKPEPTQQNLLFKPKPKYDINDFYRIFDDYHKNETKTTAKNIITEKDEITTPAIKDVLGEKGVEMIKNITNDTVTKLINFAQENKEKIEKDKMIYNKVRAVISLNNTIIRKFSHNINEWMSKKYSGEFNSLKDNLGDILNTLTKIIDININKTNISSLKEQIEIQIDVFKNNVDNKGEQQPPPLKQPPLKQPPLKQPPLKQQPKKDTLFEVDKKNK
jgi:hypothetical protein